MLDSLYYYPLRAVVGLYIRAKYNIKIHNKENNPNGYLPKKRSFVVAANHQSYTDPPAIAALINVKFAFIAKEELFRNPIFSLMIRIAGAFPVTRDNARSGEAAIALAREKIKKGRVLVIFPEGTRSKNGRIGRGRPGVASIASKANAPVLPMCLMYGRRGRNTIDVAFGKIIDPDDVALLNTREFTERIMTEIKALQIQIIRTLPEEKQQEVIENFQKECTKLDRK